MIIYYLDKLINLVNWKNFVSDLIWNNYKVLMYVIGILNGGYVVRYVFEYDDLK